MLIFIGEISGESKKYIRKKEIINTLIFGLTGIVALAGPCVVFLKPLMGLLGAIIMCAVMLIAFVVIAFLSPTKADIDKLSPTRVIISTEDNYIEAECKMFKLERQLSDVNTVFDNGEWFSFKFNGRGAPAHRFICQKDLIVEGTIEEFEKLFEGKIVKQ